MSIILQHSVFRAQFAETASFSPTNPDPLQFTAPDTINRSGGDWTAGSPAFQAGQRLQVVGTVSNDNYFTVDSLTSTDITTIEQNVVTEGPFVAGSGVTVTGVFVDPGGFERWPVANLRAGGFDGGFTGFVIPYNGLTNTVTINAGAADSVSGVDEYDWYLSQRTDVTADQYLTITEVAMSGGNTFSGSVDIVHTALAITEFGIPAGGNPSSPLQSAQLFNHVDLYVQRRSDKAIQWVKLLEVFTAQP